MFQSIRQVQGEKKIKGVQGMELNNFTLFFILNNTKLIMQSFGKLLLMIQVQS